MSVLHPPANFLDYLRSDTQGAYATINALIPLSYDNATGILSISYASSALGGALSNTTQDIGGTKNFVNGVKLASANPVINLFDTDGTFTSDSDNRVATQKATKTYVDTKVGPALNAITPLSYNNLNGDLNISYASSSLGGALSNAAQDIAGTKNFVHGFKVASVNPIVNLIDTDGTFAGDSDNRLATQKATKTYISSQITPPICPLTVGDQRIEKDNVGHQLFFFTNNTLRVSLGDTTTKTTNIDVTGTLYLRNGSDPLKTSWLTETVGGVLTIGGNAVTMNGNFTIMPSGIYDAYAKLYNHTGQSATLKTKDTSGDLSITFPLTTQKLSVESGIEIVNTTYSKSQIISVASNDDLLISKPRWTRIPFYMGLRGTGVGSPTFKEYPIGSGLYGLAFSASQTMYTVGSMGFPSNMVALSDVIPIMFYAGDTNGSAGQVIRISFRYLAYNNGVSINRPADNIFYYNLDCSTLVAWNIYRIQVGTIYAMSENQAITMTFTREGANALDTYPGEFYFLSGYMDCQADRIVGSELM